MADAFVDFYNQLDQRGAQAYVGAAAQEHRSEAPVGLTAASPTKIDLQEGTFSCEIGVTVGKVFACILPSTADEAARMAARLRVNEGREKTFTRPGNGVGGMSLFLWAV